MHSLSAPYSACIFGTSGGIGAAFVQALVKDSDAIVFAGSRAGVCDVEGVTPFAFDLADEGSIAAVAETLKTAPPLRLVIIATGILHADDIRPEKSWRDQSPEAYAKLFAINATGPALIGKHLLPLLPRDGKSVFAALSARVGSISDNRLGGWHAYRASKAALNMIVTNFARELTHNRKEAIAVTLHPGTVDTGLSAPFQRGVAAEKLFTPDYSAMQLLSVLNGLTPADSGGLFAWDGQRIAF
jgi:NAD(P)-dependent dehydrogenase (short-subunit alcohol dehydrogenase family)